MILVMQVSCCLVACIITLMCIVALPIIIRIQRLGRFWQGPEPGRATGMALARCILGKFLGVVCHAFRCSHFRRQMPPRPH
jgi:hypothetical protein